MATIIAFVSQKGGVGKSTLSRALAREAANSALKTKIADLDTQQGTSIDWHRIRLNAGIKPAVADLGDAPDGLRAVRAADEDAVEPRAVQLRHHVHRRRIHGQFPELPARLR